MLNEIWAAYAAAFVLGAAHALEVDHMVAVSAFIGGNPRLAPAVVFGVRWGIGHSVAVFVAGGLLAWSGLTLPDSAQRGLEFGVGLALVGVGAWAWFNARRLHVHSPAEHGSHGHLHAHVPGVTEHNHSPEHGHVHMLTLMGVVHGLAGTAPAVALVPVTLLPSVTAALGYLLAFGIGTTVGMGAYAGLASLAVGRAAAASLRLARSLAYGTALLSMAVGLWWLLRVSTA